MQNYITSLSTKIKLLRTTYKLSQGELSAIISLKTQSALFAWENNTSSPLFENIISLANFFCVSLEWLAGRSDPIYTVDSLKAGEKAASEQLKEFIAGEEIKGVCNSSDDFLHSIYYGEFLKELQLLSHSFYLDEKSRKKAYSLSSRANIAVLLHFVSLGDLYWAQEYISNHYNKRGVLSKVKSKFAKIPFWTDLSESYKEPGKKAKDRAINLANLLHPEFEVKGNETIPQSQPIYDVEAAYKKLSTNQGENDE